MKDTIFFPAMSRNGNIAEKKIHQALHFNSFHSKQATLFFTFEEQTENDDRNYIDKKKYFLIADKDYKALQKQAALKTMPKKLLSLEDARNYSKKLISKWATEK